MTPTTRSTVLYTADSSVDPSSHLTHTTASVKKQRNPRKIGRPNKWTPQRLRKLSRLYSFTTLPPEDIIKVLEEKDWAPKKDSATKCLNTLLGSQPRWIRPKDRKQMDMRVNGLSSCNRVLEKSIDTTVDEAAISVTDQVLDKDEHSVTEEQPPRGLMTAASKTPYRSELCLPFLGYNMPIQRCAVVLTDHDYLDCESKVEHACVHETQLHNPKALSISPFTPVATNSLSPNSEPTASSTRTSNMERRLPKYSKEYIEQILDILDRTLTQEDTLCRITKNLTRRRRKVSTRIHQAHSATTNTLGISSQSTGIIHSLYARISGRSLDPILKFPDTFLCRCGTLEDICIPEFEAYDSKICWCAVLEKLDPSELKLCQMRSAGLDVRVRDGFGNSILHFLAARGASWSLLIDVIGLGADVNAKNTAGQNFLHVIDHTVLRTFIKGESGVAIQQRLAYLNFEFYACDLFGRTFFHTLSQCLGTSDYYNSGWRWLQYYTQTGIPPHSRDAFGNCLRAAPTTASTSNNDILQQHARLIETTNLAFDKPWIENINGCNGLQCLVAADFSLHIENGKVISMDSVKRRRKSHADDLSLKLEYRYELVKSLISHGVSLNHYDNGGATVLMSFVVHLPDDGDNKMVATIFELLIRNGADVHWRNRYGETALHLAVRMGRKVATRVLLENGSNVHAQMGEDIGLLALGEMSCFEAREKPQLYASILACMALCIQYGAVASPTVYQEWALEKNSRIAHKSKN